MRYDYLVVGAGFSGSVLAERIASQLNKKVLLVEKRHHVGGNAYDEYDENGILVHRYGPHIFHTNSKLVLDYLSKFTEWIKYEHEVLAKLGQELYPIPINRITINKLYGFNFSTDDEVKKYFEKVREKRYPINNSEDIIINQVGYDLFYKFFKYYTMKQWNLEPKELSSTVCGRIPVRTNDDCRYFTDKYQFMPKEGYTKLFEKMLKHKNIEILLSTDFKSILNDIKFDKMIYTGPIDYFFDFEFGKLPYRSLRFEYKTFNYGYYQTTAQVNYVDNQFPYSRVVEHKYLSNQLSQKTVVSFEYSQSEGEPYYPVPTTANRNLYEKYLKVASKLESIKFLGRLAEYQYYNMDQVVASALTTFDGMQHER